ncbi:hypothetical protein ACE6H2_020678 [Prunus campanulata]
MFYHHQSSLCRTTALPLTIRPPMWLSNLTAIASNIMCNNKDIEVVEQVKGGLPHSSVHQLQLDGLYPGASVTKIGIIIATIGLMEEFSILQATH